MATLSSTISTPSPNTSTSKVPMLAEGKVVDHRLELSDLMETLLVEAVNSDVTFVVEGENFRAHRAILSVQSPVLRKLLLTTGDVGHNNTQLNMSIRSVNINNDVGVVSGGSPIKLGDRKAASFAIFLRYLYTGLFDVSEVQISTAAEVLAIAHDYQVESLERALGETLKAFVNIDTVFTLFQVAFDIKMKPLFSFCRDFMCENAKSVVRSARFGELSEKAVIELLSNDYFAAPEMEILRAITLWHERNFGVKLGEIFEQVRFELVSLDGWSLVDVAPVCKLLNAYNIDLEKAVNVSSEDGYPKRPRYMLATSNLALTQRGAHVLNEGRVRHGSYMIDGSYLRRHQHDGTVTGSETKIKGTSSYAVIKLAKLSYVNSLRILAVNRSTEPSLSSKPDGFKVFFSVDNISWDLLADCRHRDCSGNKVLLMFPVRAVQYIRIVGDSKSDADSLYVMNIMCPAETTESDIARYKALCPNGQTLMYIASQDREIIFEKSTL